MKTPDYIDTELFETYIAWRREDLNKPMSDRAVQMALRKLERLHYQGYDTTDIMETAIMQGWQGLHVNDQMKRQTKHPAHSKPKLTVVDKEVEDGKFAETMAKYGKPDFICRK